MVQLIGGLSAVVALLVGGLIALPVAASAPPPPPKKEPVKKPGVLHVYDAGSLFTDSAIDKAKAAMGKTQFERESALTVETFATLPKDKTPPAKGEEGKFFETWAKAEAAGDKAKGIYVLVCRSPGYVTVICDKPTRDRGFAVENEQKLRDLLLAAFKEAAQAKKDGKSDDEQAKVRDKALSAAVDYVGSVLKGTAK